MFKVLFLNVENQSQRKRHVYLLRLSAAVGRSSSWHYWLLSGVIAPHRGWECFSLLHVNKIHYYRLVYRLLRQSICTETIYARLRIGQTRLNRTLEYNWQSCRWKI